MNIKKKILSLELNPNNSIVIGSGILQALGIRKSNDIDLVVSQDAYNKLKKSGKFKIHKTQYKQDVLKDGVFEIGTSWDVLGKEYKFDDFSNNTTVLNGVRFITLDFLYKVKKSWVKNNTARPKDISDLKLIEEYKKIK